MHETITTTFVHQRTDLHRYLRFRFPYLTAEQIEDTTAAAYVDALERPEAFEQRLEQSGLSGLTALFRCVVWRKARGHLRRLSSQRERLVCELPVVSVPPGQEVAQCFSGRFETLLRQAASLFGAVNHAPLQQALEDKFATGDSDTAVAARHSLPREYLNQAKRHVQRGLEEV